MNEKMKIKTLFRSAEIGEVPKPEEGKEDSRTIEFSFSSELAADRYFGKEVLDHDEKSVDLSRLNGGSAPLLLNHDYEKQIGIIETAFIKDKRGYAKARFSKSALAEEVYNDIKDKIRRCISVGYHIRKMVAETVEDSGTTYRVTDWLPLELSVVSVPLDATIGIGRSTETEFEAVITRAEPEKPPVIISQKTNEKENKMDPKDYKEMIAMGRKFNCLDEVETAVGEGKTLDEIRAIVLTKIGTLKPATQNPVIDASSKEQRQYSVIRAINALLEKDWSQAGFEKEMSDEMAKKLGKAARGFFLPEFRALNVGSATAGGNLVATNLLPGNFIDLLRNKTVCVKAGATILSGLVGNIAIPSQSAGSASYWLTETGEPTEGAPTFGQVTLGAKHIGAYIDMTRSLLQNGTPDVENLVRSDLMAALGLGVDLAGLHGSGASNQPTGIASTSGIGSVAGGTNGADPTWANIIALETEVATDNADFGKVGYITNAKVRGKLKGTFRNATYGEIPVFTNGREAGIGELNGYDAFISNQVSSTLTKGSASGVCSAIFFGNWADLLIGLWSGIDILIDPYSLSKSGGIRVTAFQDCDIAVRHPESFAAMLDALTT